MNSLRYYVPKLLVSIVAAVFFAFLLPIRAQKPAAKEGPKTAAAPENAAQIELLETKYRFEANGDSRKEVHARVRINSELGVRQFAQLNFDYNRGFQSVEISSVRITHPSGGTADILPSAVADNPNPAVANYPAYQDVRVKSVRIFGLAPGDMLEYHVATVGSHPPFAPNFFLAHDFAKDSVVTKQVFELDLPAAVTAKPLTSQDARYFDTTRSDEGASARVTYRWVYPGPAPTDHPQKQQTGNVTADLPVFRTENDIVITSFLSWSDVSLALQKLLTQVDPQPGEPVKMEAQNLIKGAADPEKQAEALYDFVSQRIVTVDLPLWTIANKLRKAEDILSSGYGAAEEKCALLGALAKVAGLEAQPVFVAPSVRAERGPALPSVLTNPLVLAHIGQRPVWLDPSMEVAPFGMVASNLRGKPALIPFPHSDTPVFENVSNELPFPAKQAVRVSASLDGEGKLTANVQYVLRGDNELLLRVAFHQSPKEKWKAVAQLLALADGFRGRVTNVTASDPSETHHPLSVEYEVEQPKFVNWERKSIRIPAILPALGLPDAPPANSTAPIDLGTPLDVELHATLKLPAGTFARVPTGTTVSRDYAEFSSSYSAEGEAITTTRKIRFLLRNLPAARGTDYGAFVHAVQNDQAQEFTLERRDPKSSTAGLAGSAH